MPKKMTEVEEYYARMASATLVQEAKEYNERLKQFGLPERMILVHDDETGLAVEAYVTTLKKYLG